MLTPLRRWLTALACLGLLATAAVGPSCAVEEAPAPDAAIGVAFGPGDDPNAADPDFGAPKQPLPASPAGWASNQNGKQFPHYGRAEVRLCDLPPGFTGWSEGRQRKWCRAELVRQNIQMSSAYTNHELVETRGGQKYLVVYKVDKVDHSSSGRPRLYHPPDPNRGGAAYRGGIAQLRDVPSHHFKKKKPPKKPRPPRRSSARSWLDPGGGSPRSGPPGLAESLEELDLGLECSADACDACSECAATPEEAGDWCGESCPL